MTEFLKGFARRDVFGARFGTINVDVVSQNTLDNCQHSQLQSLHLLASFYLIDLGCQITFHTSRDITLRF